MSKANNAASKPRRLGRGLSGLISEPVAVPVEPETAAPPVAPQPTVPDPTQIPPDQLGHQQILVTSIHPNKYQPRSVFDQASLERLADSIRRSGVMQPIVVRPSGSGFELVAGERRWRAAKLVGLDRVPAVVRSLSDEETAEWAVVENLQREDLNPVERAFAFRSLAERFGLSHAQIAERVGFDRSTIANLIRLTELEEPIREMIAAGKLTVGHGKALLAIAPGPTRERLATEASEAGWTVRRLERAAQAPSAPAPVRAVRLTHGGDEAAKAAALADLEKQLGDHLGTKVRITTDASGAKGRLTMEFYGLDHFDGLLAKLGFASR